MRARSSVGGFSVVEALAGAALMAIALAGLGASAALAARSARLVRDTGTALAMTSERLETLRVGARSAGADGRIAAGGTALARRWWIERDRDNPTAIGAAVSWDAGSFALTTEVLP
jgi:hypothetical protein